MGRLSCHELNSAVLPLCLLNERHVNYSDAPLGLSCSVVRKVDVGLSILVIIHYWT